MPKIISSRDKGLVQSTGRGFAVSDLDADVTAYRVHQEKISVSTGDAGDVAGLAAYKLPAGSVILSLACTTTAIATNLGDGAGLVAVHVHSASRAFDLSVQGSEIAGAGVATATNVLGTDRDLDLSAAGVGLHDTIVGSGPYQPADTEETFISIASQSDLSTMTGSPEVLVTVTYVGRAPIAV